MPRLGTDNADDDEVRPLVPTRRGTATAYAAGNKSAGELATKLLLFVALVLIARNALFHVRSLCAAMYFLYVAARDSSVLLRYIKA